MNQSAESDVEPRFDVVAIAASAGGLRAIGTVISGLPPDFPAAVLIVQHLHRSQPSMLASIMARHTPLHVKQAENGEFIRRGTVYVAPPDRHLLVNPDASISLTQTELVHFVRPSADLLFDSVAGSFGKRAIAVVLTGSGLDGSIGVRGIKKVGGVVIAQDEASSEFFSMPAAAIATGSVDNVLPLAQIAPFIAMLVNGEAQDDHRGR